MNRRSFLKSAAATTVVTSLNKKFAHAADAPIPPRTLGRSGEKVSIVGLGGYHIGMQSDEQESIRIIRTALDSGTIMLDNCWDYNGGTSEVRMGKALRERTGREAVLSRKIDRHTKKAATEQMNECL